MWLLFIMSSLLSIYSFTLMCCIRVVLGIISMAWEVQWISCRPRLLVGLLLLVFLANEAEGMNRCEERFQKCLESKRNIGLHNSYLTPQECNRRISRIRCSPISMFRVKKIPNRDKWTLLETNGQKRGLVGVYQGRLTGGKEDDYNQERLEERTVPVTNGDNAKVKLTKLDRDVDPSKKLILKDGVDVTKYVKLRK